MKFAVFFFEREALVLTIWVLGRHPSLLMAEYSWFDLDSQACMIISSVSVGCPSGGGVVLEGFKVR